MGVRPELYYAKVVVRDSAFVLAGPLQAAAACLANVHHTMKRMLCKPQAGALFCPSYINIETCYDTPHLATEQSLEYQALCNDLMPPSNTLQSMIILWLKCTFNSFGAGRAPTDPVPEGRSLYLFTNAALTAHSRLITKRTQRKAI